MSAGAKPPRLDVALVLESPERFADGLGGFGVIWRAEGRLWAAMQAGAGSERIAEVGPKSTVNWRVTVRAAPFGDPRRPRPDQRFRLGARLLRILSVAETGAGGRHLVCLAQEEVHA